MQKIITKYYVDPDLYTKNAIFGWNSPHLPNFWDWHIFFKKCSNHPLSFLNLYQHAKNYANSSFYSWDIAVLKSCSLIGRELFGPYFKNQNFGRHGICARKPIRIWSFILDHFQLKLTTKFSEIWTKTHFCFSGQWEFFW